MNTNLLTFLIFYHKLGLCKEYLFLIAIIKASSNFFLNHGKIVVVNSRPATSIRRLTLVVNRFAADHRNEPSYFYQTSQKAELLSEPIDPH
jgi:hypothetical protein